MTAHLLGKKKKRLVRKIGAIFLLLSEFTEPTLSPRVTGYH